jgi:hypothetical protein
VGGSIYPLPDNFDMRGVGGSIYPLPDNFDMRGGVGRGSPRVRGSSSVRGFEGARVGN